LHCIGHSTFAFSYYSSSVRKQINYPYFFLSAAIDGSPAKNVAVLCLSPAMFVLPMVAAVRYHQVGVSEYEGNLNWWAFIGTVFCAMGGHGVVSFPYSDDETIHLYFAGVFFSLGVVVAIMQVVMDRTNGIGSNKMFCARLRLYSTLFSFVLLAIMGGLGAFILWFSDEKVDESVVFFFACVEILELFNIYLVYLSFIPEFRGYRFKICVTNVNAHRREGEVDDETGEKLSAGADSATVVVSHAQVTNRV